PSEIERAERVMHEHRPAARADQPRHRHAAAVRPQLIAALTAAHAVGGSAPIELWSPFAEPEERTIAEQERHRSRLRIDAELLHAAAIFVGDPNRQWIDGHMNRQIA